MNMKFIEFCYQRPAILLRALKGEQNKEFCWILRDFQRLSHIFPSKNTESFKLISVSRRNKRRNKHTFARNLTA